jgi:transaldolase
VTETTIVRSALGTVTLTDEATPSVAGLKIKIYADGANRDDMVRLAKEPYISGLTTNPTLMKAAGITDYEEFAHQVLEAISDKPISFEVFADDFSEMERQATKIAAWGSNVYVKIPITSTKGESAIPLVTELTKRGVQLNVTAMMTIGQVEEVTNAVTGGAATIISVFAGRVADTGRDPVPHMAQAKAITRTQPNAELLWASPRELLNIFQADEIGCDIITVTPDVLKKLALVGKDLDVYSLDTVKMFFSDAQAAGYKL